MVANQIILQGISLDEFKSTTAQEVEERIQKFLNKKEPEETQYLTRKGCALLLSISLPTLHDWCKKGILNPYRIGNRVYFKPDEIEKSLKQINQ